MVRSPRFLRPHTIIVINHTGEDDEGNELTSKTEVGRVKYDGSYGTTMATRGITTTDTVQVTMDMYDYTAKDPDTGTAKTYVSVLTDPTTQFTLKADDMIQYDGETYTITQVKVINPIGYAPLFIEVYAQ